ncbi:MAG: hypothetical protein Q8O86_01270 [Dehalococcoidia bacterium]|nr:hypothetical protein [Dehalococcoidia bacterium]
MSRLDSIVIIFRSREEEGPPRYPDNGCELAPRCLECHLPRCRFDLVDGKQWRRRPKGIPNRRKGVGSRV